MDLREYATNLFKDLGLEDIPRPDSSTHLYDECGLDSLQSFELILVTERMAGLVATPDELPMIVTLGDAYQYFQTCLAQASQGE